MLVPGTVIGVQENDDDDNDDDDDDRNENSPYDFDVNFETPDGEHVLRHL